MNWRCRFGLHDWTTWSKPVACLYTMLCRFDIEGMAQFRTCKKCGHQDRRDL